MAGKGSCNKPNYSKPHFGASGQPKGNVSSGPKHGTLGQAKGRTGGKPRFGATGQPGASDGRGKTATKPVVAD